MDLPGRLRDYAMAMALSLSRRFLHENNTWRYLLLFYMSLLVRTLLASPCVMCITARRAA